MRLRVGTFNVENLAARGSYGPRQRPDTAPALSLFHFAEAEDRENIERSIAVALEDDKRELTALAIAEMRADILALQEVDNLDVLQAFFANYVHRVSDLRYEHFKLVHGNDQRGIDVAFCMRKGLVPADALTVRSHRETTFAELDLYSDDLEDFGIRPDDRVFNRDCLEATIAFPERELTLFVNHFKAMSEYGEERAGTLALRGAEAKAVRRIIERRFGPDWRSAHWIIAGDLNDFRQRVTLGGEVQTVRPSGLDALLDDCAIDPMARLPASERWTYLYRDLVEPEIGAARGARAARLPPPVAGVGGRQRRSAARSVAAGIAVSRAARSGRARPLHRSSRHARRSLSAGRLGPAEGERSLPCRGRDRP